jgi:hypothetical protein
MTDVIASRSLNFRSGSGEVAEVIVEVGRPFPNTEAQHECYWCPYRIRGLGESTTRGIAGVDTAQALVLTLHTIPAELEDFGRRHGGTVTWLDGDDLGFPDYPPRGVA